MSTRRRDQLEKLKSFIESAPPVGRVRLAPFARASEPPAKQDASGPPCVTCGSYGFVGTGCSACGRVRVGDEGQSQGAEEIVVPGGAQTAQEVAGQ